MTTTLNFNLRHAIDADDLTRENTRKEIIEFILALDLSIGECDFTADLIERLQSSLTGDQ